MTNIELFYRERVAYIEEMGKYIKELKANPEISKRRVNNVNGRCAGDDKRTVLGGGERKQK